MRQQLSIFNFQLSIRKNGFCLVLLCRGKKNTGLGNNCGKGTLSEIINIVELNTVVCYVFFCFTFCMGMVDTVLYHRRCHAVGQPYPLQCAAAETQSAALGAGGGIDNSLPETVWVFLGIGQQTIHGDYHVSRLGSWFCGHGREEQESRVPPPP